MKKINNKLLLVNYKRNLQIGVSFWMVQGAGTCFFFFTCNDNPGRGLARLCPGVCGREGGVKLYRERGFI